MGIGGGWKPLGGEGVPESKPQELPRSLPAVLYASGVDEKYGRVFVEKGNKEFPSGEPVFLLRAQDENAEEAIRQYAELHPNEVFRAKVHAVANRFLVWKRENPDKVKQAD